jgi:lipopolysaccharide transport system ATP-binding protein
MRSSALITVENVSKRFSRSLKRSLWYGVQDLGQEMLGLSKETNELRASEFWALKDTSLQVKKGESVGLMGHNGAGKTTLLKLINGLIKPSSGRITVTGSVRALIALGAGFNPILTGRENILISGAIFGYSDHEMRERYDEILEFSELDEFIDTPVQSYSSGMLARLGFSVAIHTWPDIFLIDEVLAVGDLNFALKCYRKISEFRNQGGAIILVSHSQHALRTNCDRGVWLERGEVQKDGRINDVCAAYEQFVSRENKAPKEELVVDNNSIKDFDVTYPAIIRSGEPLSIEIKIGSRRKIENPIIVLSVANVSLNNLFTNYFSTEKNFSVENEAILRIRYNSINLVHGVYYMSLILAEGYINNQLYTSINSYKIEVQSSTTDYEVGMFKLTPQWEFTNHNLIVKNGDKSTHA